MTDFTDYLNFSNASPDIGKALSSAFVAAQQRPLIQAANQRALTQQQTLDAARKNAIANPTGANYRALMVLDPAGSEAIKRAHDSLDTDQRTQALNEVGSLYGYLQAGRPQEAKAILKRRIDADAKANLDTADDQAILDLIDEDPAAAAGAVGYHLAATVGPDKFDGAFGKVTDATRADRKLPGEMALTAAQTDKAVTETALAPIETANRQALNTAQIEKMREDTRLAGERLGLDTQRLAADIADRDARLEYDRSNLPAPAVASINSAVTKGAEARALAERATGLADQLIQAGAKGGFGAGLAGALTSITGDASTITQLRREYTQIRGAQAVKNLPPGPASDKDIQLALKGFPSENASGDTLASFLRGMAKLQNVVADRADRESEWLAGNRGSLGPAKAGFFVGNDFVAPGTKFDDVEKQYRQQRATAEAAARVGK